MGTRNDRCRAVGLLLGVSETLSPSPQPRKGPSKWPVERERGGRGYARQLVLRAILRPKSGLDSENDLHILFCDRVLIAIDES
jgi:hypothetical protein